MEIDDFVKSNSRQPQTRYRCMICHNAFNKPVVRYTGSCLLELIVFVVTFIIGAMFLGVIGIAISFIIAIIFSVIRRCSRKEICPYCKSENFIKHW